MPLKRGLVSTLSIPGDLNGEQSLRSVADTSLPFLPCALHSQIAALGVSICCPLMQAHDTPALTKHFLQQGAGPDGCLGLSSPDVLHA